MNDRMYAHAAVQENLARLRSRGVHIIEPETGRLASGAVGLGRLADPQTIALAVAAAASGDMSGLKVLVTAGPTREPLDPVRFISNRSSGRMGYAIAEAAAARGADVTLISGPTALPDPAGCLVVRVDTTERMYEEVIQRFAEYKVLIAAAAPADYAPAVVASEKLKKAPGGRTLDLRPTPDALAECGRTRKPGQFLVGFAAETENLLAGAREKLRAKHLDLIVANDVSRADVGMGSGRNEGHLIFADGEAIELPAMDKAVFAHRLLDAIVERLGSQAGSPGEND